MRVYSTVVRYNRCNCSIYNDISLLHYIATATWSYSSCGRTLLYYSTTFDWAAASAIARPGLYTFQSLHMPVIGPYQLENCRFSLRALACESQLPGNALSRSLSRTSSH